jgi:hypothetical protein
MGIDKVELLIKFLIVYKAMRGNSNKLVVLLESRWMVKIGERHL